MAANPRGLIRNPAHARNLNLFTGLRWGSITPTDIDGLIDFGGKAFVIIETKHGGSQMPTGQRLALERLTDIIASTGRPCVTLVASNSGEGDIVVGECLVTQYRYRQQWLTPLERMTVQRAIDTFRERHGLK